MTRNDDPKALIEVVLAVQAGEIYLAVVAAKRLALASLRKTEDALLG